jgi:hypothetical protein
MAGKEAMEYRRHTMRKNYGLSSQINRAVGILAGFFAIPRDRA